MAKITKKHMSTKDKKEWDQLYEYVRSNVMGYDSNQSLSRDMVLRLKGLLSNKFIENNNVEDTANYSYETVLNTFKFCLTDIQKGLRSNSFNDERHKFNYILKIVESNLNNVYVRMKNVEKAKTTTETVDVSVATHTGAKYQRKTQSSSNNKKFDEFW